MERLRLITNNPAKCEDLDALRHRDRRARRPAARAPTPENITYLETKRRRMGHLLGGLETTTSATPRPTEEDPLSDHVYKTRRGHRVLADERRRRRPHGGRQGRRSRLRNLEWFEVVGVRGHIADGQVAHFQVTVKIGFRLE